ILVLPGVARAASPTITVNPTSGSPGRGLAVRGANWPAGNQIFVQIGSTVFDTDVVCVLTVASDGAIGGNQPNGGCQVPNVPAGTQPMIAIDDQQQGVRTIAATFKVTPVLVMTPAGAIAGSPASPG